MFPYVPFSPFNVDSGTGLILKLYSLYSVLLVTVSFYYNIAPAGTVNLPYLIDETSDLMKSIVLVEIGETLSSILSGK